jgi:hypothetical protein
MRQALDGIVQAGGWQSWKDFTTWEPGERIFYETPVVPIGILMPWWVFVLLSRYVRLPFAIAWQQYQQMWIRHHVRAARAASGQDRG